GPTFRLVDSTATAGYFVCFPVWSLDGCHTNTRWPRQSIYIHRFIREFTRRVCKPSPKWPDITPGTTSPNGPDFAASGSKSKTVINIDDGDVGRKEKHLSWTPDEDVRLV
ncbi:unnamed protein product, partial [Urochloa humidicola]